MGRKYRHPTRLPPKPETPASPAPKTTLPSLSPGIGALIGILFVFSVLLPYWTVREVRGEMHLRAAHLLRLRNAASQTRDLELQRAIQLNPFDPEALQNRARFLIEQEKLKFQRLQFNLIGPKELEEALALLDRTDTAFEFRPESLRLRGEATQMLSEFYARTGQSDQATQWAEESAKNLIEAARELPRPQANPELFNASVLLAAQRVGEHGVVADCLMRMDRNGERAVIEQHDMLKNASQGWFSVGLLPQEVREFRYALLKNPDNPVVLGSLNLLATQMGQKSAVLRTLQMMKDLGRLSGKGKILLSDLNAATEPTAGSTSPQNPVSKEQAHD